MIYDLRHKDIITQIMLFCAVLLTCFLVVQSDIHSLMAFVTYIVGQTPFPEFSAVLMLDDVQIVYYDSVTWKPVYRINSTLQFHEEDQKDADIIFHDMYNIFKERAFYLKEHQNHTDGVQVHQRIVGCELLNEGKPGLIHRWDALDGQNIEEFIFDIENNKTQTKMTWRPWDQQKWIRIKHMYKDVYHPLCMKVLQRYLNMEKNNVLRKVVKPSVRFMNMTLTDSQGLQISCLATGFYPRHINLTLFRDGQPVDDDQITGGEILPNGDGAYQMRKSLVISEEELHVEHKYNCTVKHLNLEINVDITYDMAECAGSFSQSVVVSVLVFMCVAVLIITALIIWRKRRAAGQRSGTSQSKYSPTPSSMCDEHEK